ncbi:2-hydroxyacid dehydrogenase [Anaerobacillus isosaccharinicus]|uniref:Uncharacterized protein n=1 Tax=Anaerobacillus isosaccharinicus TaxID=1532552 RepID=A0A1S2KUB5_9BACI|nr:2-hydroxyacid dehydrogenase [Anaerobacillus isosaccharinicus]MBA5588305.1 hypothetical protein [Anaerobacillus isosaccharinicus]QOY38258.1 hypothetical protein AWH56_012380 [Anaerobacillus isosaccharinicus]
MISKVLYFDKVFPEFKELLQSHARNLEMLYWYEMSETEKKQALLQTTYFLVGPYKLTKELINQAPGLRMIQKAGIGVDNIDIQAAIERGVPVCNTPGGNSVGVAELTIAMILNLYRKLTILDRATKSGEWLMWEHRPSSYEMRGKVHGFIGFGNIGKETARLSKGFGTEIIYYDKFKADPTEENAINATYMEFDSVLEKADIISVHVPLIPETRNLISRDEIGLMKKNAIIINVSRGNTVNEDALIEALSNKQIAGAGLDVWATEPVNLDNPLLAFDNVIATPHIGAGTRDSLDNVLSIAFDNFRKLDRKHQPKYILNGVSKRVH